MRAIDMKALKRAFGILPAIAILAIPSTAPAEYLVPPGNSAATQYTEAYPTAGGNRDAKRDGKQQSRSPAEAIGEENARKLESSGADGRAAAEVAAATAPETTGGGGSNSGGDGGAGDRGGSGDSGGQSATGPADDDGSGVSEVLGQATGTSSSGEIGLLLPLAILAAIAWALTYLWWQRRRRAA
jgi:hypothetical protein